MFLHLIKKEAYNWDFMAYPAILFIKLHFFFQPLYKIFIYLCNELRRRLPEDFWTIVCWYGGQPSWFTDGWRGKFLGEPIDEGDAEETLPGKIWGDVDSLFDLETGIVATGIGLELRREGIFGDPEGCNGLLLLELRWGTGGVFGGVLGGVAGFPLVRHSPMTFTRSFTETLWSSGGMSLGRGILVFSGLDLWLDSSFNHFWSAATRPLLPLHTFLIRISLSVFSDSTRVFIDTDGVDANKNKKNKWSTL